MTTGIITTEELGAALNLSPSVQERVNDYERQNWAANLSSPDIHKQWTRFLSVMERALISNVIDDDFLINLIHYLSTMDTVLLLEQVRKLNEKRQSRFLELLNWIADESPDASQKANAASVRERILMAYRLDQYPHIYSPARLSRAIRVISEHLNQGTTE